MRLTGWQRERIVNEAEKAAFAARDAARTKLERELALKVRDSQLDQADLVRMNALPAKFFETSGYILAKDDAEGSKNFAQLTFEPGTRIPDFLHQTTVIVSDELWAEIAAYQADNKLLAQEKRDFREKTAGVVGSFSTAKKLLEAWPTVRDLMPANYFVEKDKPQVPAHNTIATLDAALQAGRPFDAELAAAA